MDSFDKHLFLYSEKGIIYIGNRNEFVVYTEWKTELRNVGTFKKYLALTMKKITGYMWFQCGGKAKRVSATSDFLHGKY